MFVHRNDNCRKGLTVFSFFGKRIESVQTHKICFFGNAICFKRFAVILLYVGEHRIASFFLVLHAFFITELRGIRNAENCAVSISNYFHQTQMLFRVARYGAFLLLFVELFLTAFCNLFYWRSARLVCMAKQIPFNSFLI